MPHGTHPMSCWNRAYPAADGRRHSKQHARNHLAWHRTPRCGERLRVIRKTSPTARTGPACDAFFHPICQAKASSQAPITPLGTDDSRDVGQPTTLKGTSRNQESACRNIFRLKYVSVTLEGCAQHSATVTDVPVIDSKGTCYHRRDQCRVRLKLHPAQALRTLD